jgi:hypothetical protein
MSSKSDEIKNKIFEVVATGEYDLFEVLLGLTQAQQIILESFNTGALDETGDYAQEMTLAQHQEIQAWAAEEPYSPVPLPKMEVIKPKKKKAELLPDLGDLDFGAFESPL